jgi:hypothetical protein
VAQLDFRNAFYLNLGRRGKWQKDSIKHGRLRFGWTKVPFELISQQRWSKIHQLQAGSLKALRRICESSSEDVWITFYKNELWWCRLAGSQVREDQTSRYRKIKGKWHNRDLKGGRLTLDRVPGTITQIQRFSGTCCRVKDVGALRHLLLDEPSAAYKKLEQALSETKVSVAANIQSLHWKTFETLVDLVFLSRTGWRRRSSLGATMKDIDLELEDTLTRDVYHVQVKSRASLKDFDTFCRSRPSGIHRSYFIVHTPDKSLDNYRSKLKDVELISPRHLADLVVQSGLVNWVANRIRYSEAT